MPILIWLSIAICSIQSQANEIKDAEQQRQLAEQLLKTLKSDVQLDTKKLDIIKSELNRLNTESANLTLSVANSERLVRELRSTQQQTMEEIQETSRQASIALDHYRNELIAYYITGKTFRPKAQSKGNLSDYLPFLLDARKQSVSRIKANAADLKNLLIEQERNLEKVQRVSMNLKSKRNALSRRTRDQRQLLASVTRTLKTKKQREDALNSDLEFLDQRIRALQLRSKGAALESLKGKMRWPVDGRVLRRFGQSRQDGFGDWQGLVIGATNNSEVKAVQAGKVAYAGYLLGYGLVVVIAHDDDHATIYGHNQSLKVETGQSVLARQVIAIIGNTGSLDVAALYFGVTRNGKAVNPSSWLN
ncbi:MAG: hypothetical protein CMD66_09050 [Gammaproteobacteria bacterium]|nr:hypothetical protein [Gammaproteobacteria bacterium]